MKGLNPFFIRSRILARRRLGLSQRKLVLIPSLSGLGFWLEAIAKAAGVRGS